MPDRNAPSATSDGAVIAPKMFSRFITALNGEAEMTAAEFDAREIAEAVGERILAADSLEEAVAAQDAGIPGGKDMKDIEHTVLSFEVIKGDSKYEESSLGYYLRVYAQLLQAATVAGERYQPGDDITYGVGAPNVLMLLHKARQQDRLPLDVVIRGKATAKGELLLLRLVPARVVKATAS